MTAHLGEQADQLIEQFQALHHELIAFIKSCSNAAWQRHTFREG